MSILGFTDDVSSTLEHPMHALYDAPVFDPSRLTLDEPTIRHDTPTLMAVHSAIKAALEQARLAKVVGSSLQGSVVVSSPSAVVNETLARYAAELDGIFVVSSVDLNVSVPEDVEWSYVQEFEVDGDEHRKGTVTVLPPRDHKCPRCWRYLAQEEEALCGRCEEVVAEM